MVTILVIFCSLIVIYLLVLIVFYTLKHNHDNKIWSQWYSNMEKIWEMQDHVIEYEQHQLDTFRKKLNGEIDSIVSKDGSKD
jgi:hypothetical protein